MIAQSAIVNFALGVVALSCLVIKQINTASAATKCSVQQDFIVVKQDNIMSQVAKTIPLVDASLQDKNWKSVEYLNRPIAGYLCDGANKVQIICMWQ